MAAPFPDPDGRPELHDEVSSCVFKLFGCHPTPPNPAPTLHLHLPLSNRRDIQMPPKLQKRLRLHVYQTAQLSRAKAFTPTMECLSPGLQGEVALVRSAKWIDKVWYYREASVNFIVDLSKELEPNVYACGERIRTRKVLFIIGNFGVVARAGKILISGGVWGEDMILRNEVLIDQVCDI